MTAILGRKITSKAPCVVATAAKKKSTSSSRLWFWCSCACRCLCCCTSVVGGWSVSDVKSSRGKRWLRRAMELPGHRLAACTHLRGTLPENSGLAVFNSVSYPVV